MRVLCVAVGSRGDAEPFCALSAELVSRGHKVDIFLQSDWQHLAPPLATSHALPFTMADFYRFVGSPTNGADHPNPRVRFIGTVTDIIATLVLPCAPQILEVAQSVDAVLATSLAFPVCLAIAQKLTVPVGVVHLQPLAPTHLFPHYSHTTASVDAITVYDDAASKCRLPLGESADDAETLESYHFLDRTQHEFIADRLATLYGSFGLETPTYDGFLQRALSGEADRVHIVNAFVRTLLPSTPDGRNIHHVGPLADHYVPSDWTPDDALLTFLAASSTDEPPLCVGYGSMPVAQAAEVKAALERIGLRAVLVGNSLKDAEGESEWARVNLLRVSFAPYAWLLPRCSMMLSHGGAGVLAASLRAGVPCVVSPLMGDQFFWARLVEAAGVGALAGSSLSAVTADELLDGVSRGASCREKAAKMGEAIRALPKGVELLSQVLEGLAA